MYFGSNSLTPISTVQIYSSFLRTYVQENPTPAASEDSLGEKYILLILGVRHSSIAKSRVAEATMPEGTNQSMHGGTFCVS